MKAKLSPLILIDFAILNSNFTFIPPMADENVPEIVSLYDIDVNFALFPEPDLIRVLVKAAINSNQEKKSGYSMFAEGVAIFQFSKDAVLTDEEKKNLQQYSTVSLALNSLRGFISSLTASAPFGRYILPSIDVSDLFKQKAKLAQELKEQTKKTPKKKPHKSISNSTGK